MNTMKPSPFILSLYKPSDRDGYGASLVKQEMMEGRGPVEEWIKRPFVPGAADPEGVTVDDVNAVYGEECIWVPFQVYVDLWDKHDEDLEATVKAARGHALQGAIDLHCRYHRLVALPKPETETESTESLPACGGAVQVEAADPGTMVSVAASVKVNEMNQTTVIPIPSTGILVHELVKAIMESRSCSSRSGGDKDNAEIERPFHRTNNAESMASKLQGLVNEACYGNRAASNSAYTLYYKGELPLADDFRIQPGDEVFALPGRGLPESMTSTIRMAVGKMRHKTCGKSLAMAFQKANEAQESDEENGEPFAELLQKIELAIVRDGPVAKSEIDEMKARRSELYKQMNMLSQRIQTEISGCTDEGAQITLTCEQVRAMKEELDDLRREKWQLQEKILNRSNGLKWLDEFADNHAYNHVTVQDSDYRLTALDLRRLVASHMDVITEKYQMQKHREQARAKALADIEREKKRADKVKARAEKQRLAEEAKRQKAEARAEKQRKAEEARRQKEEARRQKADARANKQKGTSHLSDTLPPAKKQCRAGGVSVLPAC